MHGLINALAVPIDDLTENYGRAKASERATHDYFNFGPSDFSFNPIFHYVYMCACVYAVCNVILYVIVRSVVVSSVYIALRTRIP